VRLSVGLPDMTIKGHPVIEAPNAADNAVMITVCAGCGELRTILFLSKDRWYCRQCRTQGDQRPTIIPIA